MSDISFERRGALTYAAVVVEVTMDTLAEAIPVAHEEIERYLGSRGIEPAGPSIIRYRSISFDAPFTIECGWVIEEGQWIESPYIADLLDEGTYVVARHDGPYSGVGHTTEEAMTWGEANDARFNVLVGEAGDEWACWYEYYPTEPAMGPEGLQGRVDVCLLTRR